MFFVGHAVRVSRAFDKNPQKMLCNTVWGVTIQRYPCITVMASYQPNITVRYRGDQLPPVHYRDGQLPAKYYRALPWWPVTTQKVPRWPVTIQKIPCITVILGYRTERYRSDKSLPRGALVI